MGYNIHYEVAALIITLAIMAHYFSNKRVNLGLTRIFLVMVFMALCANVLDLVTIYTVLEPQVIPLWANYALNIIYLAIFNAQPMVYCIYVREVVKRNVRWTKGEMARYFLPYCIDVALIATTGLTGGIFTFGGGTEYRHGQWMFVLYISAMYYMACVLGLTLAYRTKLTRSRLIVMMLYSIGGVAAIALQMLVPGLMVVQFAVSLSLFLIYLSLENPEDFIDAQVGMSNRLAFTETVGGYLRNARDFEVLGIQVGGIEYLRDVVGMTNINGLMKTIGEFLEGICGSGRKAFFVDHNRFMILAEGAGTHWDTYREVLKKRFAKPFTFENVDFSLDLTMTVLPNAEHKGIADAEDVLRVMEQSLKEADKSGSEMAVADGARLLEKGRRESEILHILKEALRLNRFEVYYQPIYNVPRRMYSSAEALIRLNDDQMGYISPEEFVPIAERHGLIIEMGEFVFREVCRFIAEERLWEKGIEYIDVNLSTVQCMHERLHEELIAIMDEYGLPYHCINLEITETAAVLSSEALRNNMARLMEKGVNFSLDDYGTGFANTATIVDYPFHTIKLDKSMLWSAADSEKAMWALEYMIAMIKAMHMEIICEGVETLEQAQMLERMGCDFFQGYYYSRPVPAADFLRALSDGPAR